MAWSDREATSLEKAWLAKLAEDGKHATIRAYVAAAPMRYDWGTIRRDEVLDFARACLKGE